MGACLSSPTGPTPPLTEHDRALHRTAEKALKEQKARLAAQVKVLLLGSGDSGKSTILKQMRVIHRVPFTDAERESYRQLVWENVVRGLKYLLDAMGDMGLEDLRDGEAFPMRYYGALDRLWGEEVVRQAWARGNEAAVPENLAYFLPALPRLFAPAYTPTEQDIVQARARTIGITETVFRLREHEMLMVDVGGQKSERRKWIHCFQDVTSILFLVSLSGYDQCLVEDRDANQMQDAMTIWDSICHSQWFKQTSIILFLNKNDLFQKKIKTSDIRSFFPDFEGEPGSASAGLEYFKKRFGRLAQKAGRAKEREIYIHTTTATDTENLRVIMAAVEASSCGQISKAQR
ncbi:heterotrimeric G-protein alpha subunit, GPA2-like protein [Mycena galericulata]|nr:heterotrimeric G-protein alpha subunit, GPA2-like protein [Mycena galericulata]